MASTQAQYVDGKVQVDEGSGTISITGFTLKDREVAEYFASQDPGRREEMLEDAIRAGVLALKSVDVGKRVDYVKREFEQLRNDVEKSMDKTVQDMEGYLGEDGKMPRMMEEYVGENGEVFKAMEKYMGEGGIVSETARDMAAEWADKLRASMDPREEKSPLRSMRQDILDKLDGVMEQMAQRMGEKKVTQKTTIKGYEFEEDCIRRISKIAHVTGDVVADTTTEAGDVPRSKKGDLVIEVADTHARIAIELKDVRSLSVNKTRDTLDEAIKNRAAHFGLLIAKNVEAFSAKAGWFHEFGSADKLAVALGSEADDEEDTDGLAVRDEILLIAYKWARARAMANALDEKSVDAKTIAAKMNDVRGHISGLSKIKRQATSIIKSANSINGLVRDVIDDANADLDDAIASLQKASPE